MMLNLNVNIFASVRANAVRFYFFLLEPIDFQTNLPANFLRSGRFPRPRSLGCERRQELRRKERKEFKTLSQSD